MTVGTHIYEIHGFWFAEIIELFSYFLIVVQSELKFSAFYRLLDFYRNFLVYSSNQVFSIPKLLIYLLLTFLLINVVGTYLLTVFHDTEPDQLVFKFNLYHF